MSLIMTKALTQALFERLIEKKLTVVTAESLTGGGVAAALTSLSGSSSYFLGGVMAYSNQLKVELLGVPLEVLAEHGAVSEECARAMAEGARRKLGAGVAVATTGIAGPTGATPTKPVGLVWLAVATETGVFTLNKIFDGDRAMVTRSSINEALALLLNTI